MRRLAGGVLKHAPVLLEAEMETPRRAWLAPSFLRHVAETFATRILLVGIGLVTVVVVTRSLGPTGRGLFAVAGAIAATGVQLGNLGLHASNTYAVARKPSLLSVLVGNSLMVGLLLGGLGAAGTWGVLHLWPRLAPVDGSLLLLALAAIPVGLVYLLLQNLLLGTLRVRAFNLLEIGAKAGILVLIGALVLLHRESVEAVFGTTLLASALAAGVAFLLLRSSYPERTSFRASVLANDVRYGTKAYLAALLSFLVLRADLFMVQHSLGPAQAGFYSIAVALADMMYLLPAVVGSLLFPKLSNVLDGAQRASLTRRAIRGTAWMMLGIGVAAAVFARPALMLLFGREFLPSLLPFALLIPGVMCLAVHTLVMNHFAAGGMPPVTVYAPAAGFALNLLLNVLLIPRFGIGGAAFASSAAYALMLGAGLGAFSLPAVRAS